MYWACAFRLHWKPLKQQIHRICKFARFAIMVSASDFLTFNSNLPMRDISRHWCAIYHMRGRAVSDIQTRTEGEMLHIPYTTDANDESIHILQQFKIDEWYLMRELNWKCI
jgi:hypothetical protein